MTSPHRRKMSPQPLTPSALSKTNQNVPAITPPLEYKTYPTTPTLFPPGYTSSSIPGYAGPSLGFNPPPAPGTSYLEHTAQQIDTPDDENADVSWILREIRIAEKIKYCKDRAAGKACAGFKLNENFEEWIERLIQQSDAQESSMGQVEDDADPGELLRSFVELAGLEIREPYDWILSEERTWNEKHCLVSYFRYSSYHSNKTLKLTNKGEDFE
ncbi:hypothetical protein BZA77DRAFT_294122 [Pyronema omphalodes]|nr:hypothetical protein BZA77DRAFT_294122 [Pyronema omphalodes]